MFLPSDFRRPAELTAEQLQQAARLVRLAMPHFYRTLPDDRSDAIIGMQLLQLGNELSECQVSKSGETVTAVLCTYPSSEQVDRQRCGLHQFAGMLERHELPIFFGHLNELREQMVPISSEGQYLARFAVHEERQGTSLASDLLGTLSRTVGCSTISLHVRSDNARALAFYKKQGFKFADTALKDYRVMERR